VTGGPKPDCLQRNSKYPVVWDIETDMECEGSMSKGKQPRSIAKVPKPYLSG